MAKAIPKICVQLLSAESPLQQTVMNGGVQDLKALAEVVDIDRHCIYPPCHFVLHVCHGLQDLVSSGCGCLGTCFLWAVVAKPGTGGGRAGNGSGSKGASSLASEIGDKFNVDVAAGVQWCERDVVAFCVGQRIS